MADAAKTEHASAYLFHQEAPGVFVRRCFGIEELSAIMMETCDGFAHLTVSAAVKLDASLSGSADVLCAKARSAWTGLRAQTPAIACRGFRESEGDKRFAFRYEIPQGAADVDAWLDETVVFDQKPAELYEKHRSLKDGHWWRCSDNRYVAEVHAAPLLNGEDGAQWSFHIAFAHNSIDGRNSFAILDSFLSFFSAEINGSASPAGSIEWGLEVARLPPPGAFIPALVESGVPPLLEAPRTTAASASEKSAEAPAAPVPWLYPVSHTGGKGDVTQLFVLTEDLTARLCAAARAHGATINHVITAISALAHAEAMLAAAAAEGDTRYAQVAALYGQASIYLVAFNFINHRQSYPGGYDSYTSPHPPPLCTCDGVPLFVPMDAVRSSLALPGGEGKAMPQRVPDVKLFWEGLVHAVSGAWKSTDRSFSAYLAREQASHTNFPAFNPAQFAIPALIVSSVGDLARLGTLSAFVPSVDAPAEKTTALAVTASILGIRLRTAPLMNLLWTFRGRLHCHFLAAEEHTRPETVKHVVNAFEDWVRVIIGPAVDEST